MGYPHLGPLLQILGIINNEEGVNPDRLQEVTGLSHPTLKRHIHAAREHGVIINWEGGNNTRFVIREWRAINPGWRGSEH